MIPIYIQEILKKLAAHDFEAYIVGGCVRDFCVQNILVKKENEQLNNKNYQPKDWDITTNARPEQMLKIFSRGKYENQFGTVLVPVEIEEEGEEKKEVVEITTYRSEQGYGDRRHPDEIKFEDKLENDLERRDFTINAMAMKILDYDSLDGNNQESFEIVDLFGGQKDLKKRIVRAVGEPFDRFREDALRMMRAIRFACQLNFSIEDKTLRAIKKLAGSIKFISNERIRDELVKILQSDQPYHGIMLLHESNLLNYIIPELLRGVGVKQDRHHTYTVFKHSVLSLKYCPNKDWQVRLASLLHDIGKPQTKKIIKKIATFYNHEYAGANIVKRVMKRLKFSVKDSQRIVNLIRNHMFYYNVGEVTASSVRRLIKKVGKENLSDLIDIRIADRLGSGVPKAKPYKLRHLEYMMEKVQFDPVSVKSLVINGDDLIKSLNIKPGPKIGAILDVLLSEVIEDPALNNTKFLKDRSKSLSSLNLEELRAKAQEIITEKQVQEDQEMKKEYFVN